MKPLKSKMALNHREERRKRELTNILFSSPDSRDEVEMALALSKSGCEPYRVASALSWKDFESFISKALEDMGFKVMKCFYTSEPRTQIDILAEKDYVILCIDCKHFSKQYSLSYMARIAKKQIHRANLLRMEVNPRARIVPTIVTLREDYPRNICHVPIVPTSLLPEFASRVTGLEEGIISI